MRICRSTAAFVLSSASEGSKSMPSTNCSMSLRAPRISRQRPASSLKGKDRLSDSPCADWLAHPFRGRQIDSGVQQLAQTALQAADGHERLAPGRIEVHQQIDIGGIVALSARG